MLIECALLCVCVAGRQRGGLCGRRVGVGQRCCHAARRERGGRAQPRAAGGRGRQAGRQSDCASDCAACSRLRSLAACLALLAATALPAPFCHDCQSTETSQRLLLLPSAPLLPGVAHQGQRARHRGGLGGHRRCQQLARGGAGCPCRLLHVRGACMRQCSSAHGQCVRWLRRQATSRFMCQCSACLMC